MKQLQMTKEEQFHLKSIFEKRQNLTLQDQLLAAEWNGVLSQFGKRNSVELKPEDQVNLDNGVIIIVDLPKVPEKQPGKSGKKKNGK